MEEGKRVTKRVCDIKFKIDMIVENVTMMVECSTVEESVHAATTRVATRVAANGRVVIPAEIRDAMGLKSGDVLCLTVEGKVLKIESQRARIRRIQESLRKHIPESRCLSEELIAERREEARREHEE